MNFKKEVIRGVRWTSFSTLVLVLTQLITTAILVRLLNKSDFGIMAIIMVVRGFAELFMDFGLTIAILHKQNISQDEYSSLYWVNMGIGFVIYALLCGITPLIASFYEESELLKLIPLMGLAIPLSSIGRQQKTVLQKDLYFKNIAFGDIISSIFGLVFAVYLASIECGIYALVFSNLIRYLLANIIYFFIGIRKIPIKFHISIKEVIPFFKIGMFYTGGQVVNYFSKNFDVLIIGKLLGADALGIYNLAKELVLKPSAIISPIISRVITPLFAKMQDEKSALLDNFFSIQKIMANINAYVYIGIALFACPIVTLYYGNGYENCIPLVSILALYYMLREYGQPISMLCIAKGRTDIDMWWNCLVLFFSPVVVFLGALYSVKMVAIGMLISNILLFYPGWYMYARRLLGISFGKYYKILFQLLRLYILPYIMVFLFLYLVKLPDLWMLLCGGSLYTLIIFALLVKFDKDSHRLLLGLLRK